jgi:hypothetical protein
MQTSTAILQRVKDEIGVAESRITASPGRFLVGALFLGVFIGWWIKRR